MTEEQAIKAYAYVRKYGKKWTVPQVAKFYIALCGLIGTCDRTVGDES